MRYVTKATHNSGIRLLLTSTIYNIKYQRLEFHVNDVLLPLLLVDALQDYDARARRLGSDMITLLTGWGSSPVPILPKSLREKSNQEIPGMYLHETGLPSGTRYSDLDAKVWSRISGFTPTFEDHIYNYVRNNVSVLKKAKVLPIGLPNNQAIESIPFSYRAMNILESNYGSIKGLIDVYGSDVLRCRNCGIKTLIEILCLLEAAVSQIQQNTYEDEAPLFDEKNLSERLDDIVSSIFKGNTRNIELIMKRYGWGSSPPQTLEMVGRRFALTRERVRQIQAKFERKFRNIGPQFPTLEMAENILNKNAPILASEAKTLLVEKGLVSRPLDPEGIRNLIFLMNEDPAFYIEKIGKRRVIIRSELYRVVGRVLVVTNKQISKYGITNLSEVSFGLSALYDLDLDIENVNSIIQLSPRYIFLDEKQFWFWAPTARNRIRNIFEKMFSVSNVLSAGDVREGIRRAFKQRGIKILPPKSVIVRFAELLDGFNVRGDLIECLTPNTPEVVLSNTEIKLLNVFNKEPQNILTREQVYDKMLEVECKELTIGCFLEWSPIISRITAGLWAIRGRDIQAGTVEALLELKRGVPKKKVIKDYGWTHEGNLFIHAKLTKGIIRTGVIGIPAALKSYITPGAMKIFDKEGTAIGKLGVNEKVNAMWGFMPFIRRYGGDAGDCLLLDLDLKANTAFLEIGDESLIETGAQ